MSLNCSNHQFKHSISITRSNNKSLANSCPPLGNKEKLVNIRFIQNSIKINTKQFKFNPNDLPPTNENQQVTTSRENRSTTDFQSPRPTNVKQTATETVTDVVDVHRVAYQMTVR
ncbi:hypothetical protein QTP88_018208 [Uroleucon formosanum]